MLGGGMLGGGAGGGPGGGGGSELGEVMKMMESLGGAAGPGGPTPGAAGSANAGATAGRPSVGASGPAGMPKPSGGSKSPKGAKDGGVRGGGGGFAPPTYLLETKKDGGADVAVITVDMAGVTNGMSDVDLEVGGQAVRVSAAGKQPLLVDLPFTLDADVTKAKFSKKKGELKITVRS